MVTLNEIELLAGILQRAGVSQIEALWLNNLLNRLRTEAIDRAKPHADVGQEAQAESTGAPAAEAPVPATIEQPSAEEREG